MTAKLLEIRDRGTCVPALAFKWDDRATVNASEAWLLRKCGYGPGTLLLVKLDDGEGHTDGYEWSNRRTMTTVHLWLEHHFSEVQSGDVVDVRVILGEEKEPAISDRLYDECTRNLI